MSKARPSHAHSHQDNFYDHGGPWQLWRAWYPVSWWENSLVRAEDGFTIVKRTKRRAWLTLVSRRPRTWIREDTVFTKWDYGPWQWALTQKR